MSERRPGKPKLSRAVRALAQAALALPGVAVAADVQTDYLFSWYRESDLPASRNTQGRDLERYDIQSHLFRVLAPVVEHALGLNLTFESMSGASPWYVRPAPDGRPVQVMSGASIREERVAADASAALAIPRGHVTATLGASDEDDYQSVSGGLAIEKTDEREAVTWSAGARYSDDRLTPTQGRTPTDVTEADKTTASAYGGVSVVLDRRTLFQAGVSLQRNDGYLTDPYKQVYIESGPQIVSERRPGQRLGWAGTLKLRRHVREPDAALHLDYRYYHDDWEIDSHTVEAAWHQRVAVDWRVIPSVRWYSQSQASFYGAYFPVIPADGYRSSDYRLSPFGAISARLDVVKTAGPLGLGAGLEYYDADAQYALGEVAVENPGLVQYLAAQLRFSYRF